MCLPGSSSPKDGINFGIRDITCSAGAWSRICPGNSTRVCAQGTSATRCCHLERAAIARDANSKLAGRYAGLGDHGQSQEGLGKIGVRTQTITCGTAVDAILIGIIPLAVEIISHVNNIIGQGCHFLDMVAFEVPE